MSKPIIKMSVIEYAKRDTESAGKNVATFLKIGVRGEQGKDNRKVHQGSEERVWAYAKNAHNQRWHLNRVCDPGYLGRRWEVNRTIAPLPHKSEYTRQYCDICGDHNHRIRIGIERHKASRPLPKSPGY